MAEEFFVFVRVFALQGLHLEAVMVVGPVVDGRLVLSLVVAAVRAVLGAGRVNVVIARVRHHDDRRHVRGAAARGAPVRPVPVAHVASVHVA